LSYDIIQVDWTICPITARSQTVGKVLQGNADPCLLYGDANTIRTKVEKMVNAFGAENYIANLGHGMLPDHDPDNLRVYLETIVI
jgi:uroporphyrinogen decarboxylase